MAKRDVKKFANKKFLKTVDMELLRQFFERFQDDIDLDLDALTPDSVYEFLTEKLGEDCPPEMLEDLHKISDMSTDLGMDLLQQRALLSDPPVTLVPMAETEDGEGGMHINPRYLSLRTYLEHRGLFAEAHRWLSFIHSSSPEEFLGIEEDVEVDLDDPTRIRFEEAAADYFNARYKGNYCKLSFFEDHDGINILITHGKYPVTTIIIDHDEEKPFTFREVRQDALGFNPQDGRLKVYAPVQEERAKLAELFADIILKRTDFFAHADCQNLYTLNPLNDDDFKLDGRWDSEFRNAYVNEVQISDGKRGGSALTARGPKALERLNSMNGDGDTNGWGFVYAKIRFEFLIRQKKRTKMVKIKPPSICTFKRETLEEKIMEHLRRNGFCQPRKPMA